MDPVVLTLLISTLISTVHCTETSASDQPDIETVPGHMQPLGSHMEPKPLPRIKHMPTPQEFQEKYVSRKQAVILEGLMSDQPVIKNWQSDDYLRTHFGDAVMGAEQRKKENRSVEGFELTMREFLDRYREENIYMVSDLPEGMFNEWKVPKFMQCGGFASRLSMAFVWFSSGGTKSVLHTDTMENLHCLVSGKKKFVLIKPYYVDFIGPEHKLQGYYNMDVERVNMTAYPNLPKIPWHLALVNPGDCLYLPYLWIHHVQSDGRNMGVNIWWDMFQFNSESCPTDPNILPDFAPLSDFEFEMATRLRLLIHSVVGQDDRVWAEDVQALLNQEPEFKKNGQTMELEDVWELFDMLQPGCEGVLTYVESISKTAYRKAAIFVNDVIISSYPNAEDLPATENPEHSQQSTRDEL